MHFKEDLQIASTDTHNAKRKVPKWLATLDPFKDETVFYELEEDFVIQSRQAKSNSQ